MIMKKKNVFLRLIRNIIIAILSIGWISPMKIGIDNFLLWMYRSHQSDYLESVDSGFVIQLSGYFFYIGLLWLGIVIAFWIFIIANKLWPPKKE
ncbi:MAG: hypothetical protein KAS96_10955 [Planctomycetes bacterium]|nr:hypothetical protein [Planctomycetota bacterium]